MLTIPGLFKESVKKFPNNIILWENTDGEYIGLTYTETYNLVQYFAAGLLSIGVKKGDRIALVSEGRNNWLICELGMLFIGAINVPLSVKLEEATEIRFRLSHAECSMIIVSESQIKKIKPILKELPNIKNIVLLDNAEEGLFNSLLYTEIIEKGKALLKEQPEIVEQKLKSVVQNDIANISYTSGTIADPKGIILSHRNYTANVEQSLGLFKVYEHYKTLLILPWDHSFAHSVGIYAVIKGGASIASVQRGKTALESIKNISKNLKQIEPYFLLSVPALARNMRTNIEKAINKKGMFASWLFSIALNIAYKYNAEGYNKGKGWKLILYPTYKLFDKLIFKKIKSNFGRNMQFFVGGGALLDVALQRFFYAIGVPMFQGYGLSEAAPVISSNNLKFHKLGSSGKIAPNIQLKIIDATGNELPRGNKGEIVIKGENVMLGYWKNPKSTEETLKDGWLYTGDMGYLDSDDYLFVMGRFKSLLIASDGEKYSPEGIEEAFMQNSKFIDQCMLYNNQNPYTTMLIYPNKDNILNWLEHHKYSSTSGEGIIAALRLIQDEINKFKPECKHANSFPVRWLPSATGILEEGFTENNHFLNSTLKMVRGKITKYYANRIKYLYTPEAKDICNEQNIKAIDNLLNKQLEV